MEQLHTQNEPQFCGLATLVTVLNALNVDPHRRWKGNWRFYSEELLDCVSLQVVKEKGIDFDKLASLAQCNGLVVNAIRASDTTLEEFRQVVSDASMTERSCLVFAYNRQTVGQTGTGHYSPLGAYHAQSDMVLILDCARFKYRPHWLPTSLLFRAMNDIDPDTERSRGFMIMSV